MESTQLGLRRTYAYREKRGAGFPLLKVVLLDKVARKGKIKVRFEDGPHPGLEEYVTTRQIICPWGERKAVLRDEQRAARLVEHAGELLTGRLPESQTLRWNRPGGRERTPANW
jgi:hypothetical protein